MIIDLMAYMKAGYVPLMGCRKDVACDYVKHQFGFDNVVINDKGELMGEGIIPTGYYWEYDNLFKKAEVSK